MISPGLRYFQVILPPGIPPGADHAILLASSLSNHEMYTAFQAHVYRRFEFPLRSPVNQAKRCGEWRFSILSRIFYWFHHWFDCNFVADHTTPFQVAHRTFRRYFLISPVHFTHAKSDCGILHPHFNAVMG